jgi:hypothetical protein
MSVKLFLKFVLAALAIFTGVACAGEANNPQTMTPRTLFESRCTKCHTLDRTYKNETTEYWTATVQKMKSKLFSKISDEDAKVITQYLIDTRTGAFKTENAERK